MEITPKLRERFCKDCNIPINLFHEPYFSERLELYDMLFCDTLNKWNIFTKELEKYHSEQEYFEEYNRVKDAAISSIKNSEAYQMFCEEDMNKFQIQNKNFSSHDIYHDENKNRVFISIDMKQANFTALQHYGDSISKSMFAGASTWEDFISLFTDNKHIINSKYIRQVILGNCNPKRHITYEKHLMDKFLTQLLETEIVEPDKITFFSNDEIVIDVTGYYQNDFDKFCDVHKKIIKLALNFEVYLKPQLFTLRKIYGANGWFKEILFCNSKVYFVNFEIKCCDANMMPFVIRKLLNEEITENDKVFYHNGLLAKYIHVPEISIDGFD